MDVAGKTAFVTGGASGIGYGMAEAFAVAGMTLVLADVDEAALAQAASSLGAQGARVLTVALDVRDRAAWDEAAARAESALGSIDVLCNNAGVTDFRPVLEIPEAYWEWIIAVNLTGVFNGVRAIAARMVAAGRGGHIVNTASSAGLIPPQGLTHAAYSASKYAVVGFSEALRDEMAPHGIGVSVLLPGMVKSRITENIRRLRPKLDAPPPRSSTAYKSLQAMAGQVTDEALEPRVVGEMVLTAVKANTLFVPTHRAQRAAVEARHAALMKAFDNINS